MPVGTRHTGPVPSALSPLGGSSRATTPQPSPGRGSMSKSQRSARHSAVHDSFVEEQMHAAPPGALPVSGAAAAAARSARAGATRLIKPTAASMRQGRGSKRGSAPLTNSANGPYAPQNGGGFLGVPNDGGYPQSYGEQDDYDEESEAGYEEYDEPEYPPQNMQNMQNMGDMGNMGQGRRKARGGQMMAPPVSAQPPYEAMPGMQKPMPNGYNGAHMPTAQSSYVDEKMDDAVGEGESEEDLEGEGEDAPAPPQQQQQEALASNAENRNGFMPGMGMGMGMQQPHCDPLCWWRSNRAWDRIKTLPWQMKLLYGWMSVAGLMNGIASMMYSLAFKDLSYKTAVVAVPVKDVVAGLIAGMIVPAFLSAWYSVASIYCLTPIPIFRPVAIASGFSVLAMLIFSLAGPPKVLIGTTIRGDANLDSSLLRVCAAWSFIVLAMGAVTPALTWYCYQAWFKLIDMYGLPDPFIRRHTCKGFRTMDTAYEGYGGGFNGMPQDGHEVGGQYADYEQYQPQLPGKQGMMA